MIRLYRKLIGFLKPFFRCRYAYKCPYYNPEAFTCSTPDAEHGYCGQFREFSASDSGKYKSGERILAW
jgi:putative component of membrane protein insertase Oxa1/YidC/SpoIIIJ protein YidD